MNCQTIICHFGLAFGEYVHSLLLTIVEHNLSLIHI